MIISLTYHSCRRCSMLPSSLEGMEKVASQRIPGTANRDTIYKVACPQCGIGTIYASVMQPWELQGAPVGEPQNDPPLLLAGVLGGSLSPRVQPWHLEGQAVSQYRKRPVLVEAVQWHKDGDHPEVERVPRDQYNAKCPCGLGMLVHGSIWHGKVCPGDWIVKEGESWFAVHPEGFHEKYEAVP